MIMIKILKRNYGFILKGDLKEKYHFHFVLKQNETKIQGVLFITVKVDLDT